jgi:hypothetical protein
MAKIALIATKSANGCDNTPFATKWCRCDKKIVALGLKLSSDSRWGVDTP